MTLAVIGAAGAIGRSVSEAWRAAGRPVRLVGRDRMRLERLARPGDEVVPADVATPEGCRAALAGAGQAVYALGLPYAAAAFAAYAPMMRLFVEAARAAGLRRLLLVTNVYPYGRPQGARVAEDHPRVPCSVKGRHRKEQEDILLAAAGGGLETMSLRLPDFYGPDVASSYLDLVVKAAVAGRMANLLGPADTPHEYLFTPDAGPVVRALLDHPGNVSGAYNLAGAGIITQREMANLIFAAAGHAPRLRIMAPWMQNLAGLFVPIIRELNEMRYLHETPVLLDDAKLRALLPGLRKTPYPEGARQAVAAAGGRR